MATTMLKLFQSKKSEIFDKESMRSLLQPILTDKSSSISISPQYITNTQDNDPILLDHVLVDLGFKPMKLIYNTYYEQLIRVVMNKGRTYEQYLIKKISKRKNVVNVCCDNANPLFVETNPIHEAALFQHCTKLNKQNKTYAKYICKYVDFFEDNNSYYLILEDKNYISLSDWLKKAFEYMTKNQLNHKHYRKILKYLFYQITLLMNWLHTHHGLCHLSIQIQNFMVFNGEFIKNVDGSVKIPTNIQVKLCSLATAKVFDTNAKQFEKEIQTDVKQMGILLYLLAFGKLPIETVIENNQLKR